MTAAWGEEALERVPCEVCGRGSDRPWVVRPDGLPVVRCECGFAYLSPRPRAEAISRLYERGYYGSGEGVGYAEYRSPEIRDFIRGVARKNLLFLRRQGWRPRGSRLLELGCAFGDFCAEAAGAGARPLGVDLSAEGIDEARTRHPGLDFQVGDAVALLETPGPGSFDAVCAYEVIEHCPSVKGFLGQVAALLCPGGYLALSTPNLARAQALAAPGTWLGFTSSFEHLCFLSPEVLLRLAEASGLRLQAMATVEEHRVAKPRRAGFRVRDLLHPHGDWDTARRMRDFDPACRGHQLNAVFRKV